MTKRSAQPPLIALKIWGMLTSVERRTLVMLLAQLIISMALETLSVSMLVPTMALLTQANLVSKFPALQPVLRMLGDPGDRTLAIDGVLILVALYLVKALFLSSLIASQTRFAFGLRARLSQRLYTIYLRQSYTFHLQRNSAELVQNVIHETDLLISTGLLPGMLLLTETLVLAGLFALLLVVDPWDTLFLVSLLSAAAWGFHHFTQGHIMRWGEARQTHDSLRLQHLQQGLSGAKEVKLLGRETEFLQLYNRHNIQGARAAQLQITLQQLPRLWLELLAVSCLAIVMISMLAQNRPLGAIVPILSVFAAAAFRLIPSVNRIMGAIQSIRYGLPVINMLHREIQLAAPEAAALRRPAAHFRRDLELDRVNYTYPGSTEPVLKDISLLIRCGESVGFVGPSGAGKSTLVDIVLGLLLPDTGVVRVDGKDTRDNLRNWQDQIGYVPQSMYLTDDTLRRNVAFGLSEEMIDDAAVRRAIRAAQLEGFVDNLPAGLETFVGERGVRLSGGQRQRIGIARALYHDPAVLVLDEATSALDISTEHDVAMAVRALQSTKTVLIVAHRLSAVAHCDRLYRLERGKLVETDGPMTLRARNADIQPLLGD